MPRWVLLAALPSFYPLTPSPPPSAFSSSISASLRARRALNYGDNAARSSGLIELLLESHDAVFALRKKGQRREKKKRASFSCPPPLPPSCHPSALPFFPLSGSRSREWSLNGVNFREIISSACETRFSRARRWARIRRSNSPKLGLSSAVPSIPLSSEQGELVLMPRE